MIAVICTGATGATFINWSIQCLAGHRLYWNAQNQLVPFNMNPLQGHTCHEHWVADRSTSDLDINKFKPETVFNLHPDFAVDPYGNRLVETTQMLWGRGVRSVWIKDTDCVVPECNIRHGETMPDTQEEVLKAYKWWQITRGNLQDIEWLATATITPEQFNRAGITELMQDLNITIESERWPAWQRVYDEWWRLNEESLLWRFRLPNYQAGELPGIQERWRRFYQDRLTPNQKVL